MDISKIKRRFASEEARATDAPSAAGNAINASLQRNPTYSSPTADGSQFRSKFATALHEVADLYKMEVSDQMHLKSIEVISSQLSLEFANILQDEHLRIGTTQKALNLYLKTLWCLDLERPDPPHCPVDGTILGRANISGKWTELDSSEVYMEWIKRLRSHALGIGFDTLAEWELVVW
jgi:hypothetical protein